MDEALVHSQNLSEACPVGGLNKAGGSEAATGEVSGLGRLLVPTGTAAVALRVA